MKRLMGGVYDDERGGLHINAGDVAKLQHDEHIARTVDLVGAIFCEPAAATDQG